MHASRLGAFCLKNVTNGDFCMENFQEKLLASIEGAVQRAIQPAIDGRRIPSEVEIENAWYLAGKSIEVAFAELEEVLRVNRLNQAKVASAINGLMLTDEEIQYLNQ